MPSLQEVLKVDNHQVADQVASGVAAGSASVGIVGFLAEANVVLVTLATLIAIISGGWTLWDRYRMRKEKREEK